jgi:hypothetical protein
MRSIRCAILKLHLRRIEDREDCIPANEDVVQTPMICAFLAARCREYHAAFFAKTIKGPFKSVVGKRAELLDVSAFPDNCARLEMASIIQGRYRPENDRNNH